MANTTAPLSEVGIVSMAGDMLDEFNISSLDENTPLARFAARNFGYVRDEVLQLYPWHPASKRAALPVLEEAPPFGWSYAYALPSDCIRLHPLRRDGALNGEDIPYELEGGQVLTDQSGTLYIRYTQKLTNIAKWRPLMARVLVARLAVYGSMRITGKQGYFDKCQGEYLRVMAEAAHADSLERGTPENYSYSQDVFTARGLAGSWDMGA